MGTLAAKSLVAAALLGATGEAWADPGLPPPSGAPLAIDPAQDPILGLARGQASTEAFRTSIAAAVARHPATGEFRAAVEEAEAGLMGAREARLPSADVSLSTYRIISREFSNDPNNIIERSRPSSRTDALIAVEQTLIDFGAGAGRERAAGARLRAAGADLEATADRVALSAIAAWYDLFGYRILVDLAEAFVANLRDMRGAVETRVQAGVAAQGDLAQADLYIARAETRIAQFRRAAATAEARFAAATGEPAPRRLSRAPVPVMEIANAEEAEMAAGVAAPARSARALAEAAREDARAARADLLPRVGANLNAGRYGVFETDRDYDIRGGLTLRYRLFGGANARGEQAAARARAADARADRVRQEAERDAVIALSDVRALEAQQRALEAAYFSSRRSRDVIVERFLTTRGTLFDVVTAENAFFDSATAYVQSLTELDAARYVLLSRTGRLLDALGIEPSAPGTAQ